LAVRIISRSWWSRSYPINRRVISVYMSKPRYSARIFISLSGIFILLLTACNPMRSSERLSPTSTDVNKTSTETISTHTYTPKPTLTFTRIPTDQPTSTPKISPSSTKPQPSSTVTMTASPSSTPTVIPTYAILRGTVREQSNCRYGPGAAYLYKYGLYSGNNLEVIGRNETGSWILVQAIGGSNPCWLKATLMDVKGDIITLAPASMPLPQSPYYGSLTGVASVRDGDRVTISWHPLYLRAGDDSLQYPYLVEAWLCQTGKLVFTPIGSWEPIVVVTDEPGCSEPSHARVYGVEKHGYTNWVEVPWTQP
jgi:hypothetical protein